MYAVNAGYRVVLPKDAVPGITAEYGAAMIANTRVAASRPSPRTDDLLQLWNGRDDRRPIPGRIPRRPHVPSTRRPGLDGFVSSCGVLRLQI